MKDLNRPLTRIICSLPSFPLNDFSTCLGDLFDPVDDPEPGVEAINCDSLELRPCGVLGTLHKLNKKLQLQHFNKSRNFKLSSNSSATSGTI